MPHASTTNLEDEPLFVCYRRCSTCAKARTWLQSRGIHVHERDIKGDNPTYAELDAWQERSGLPVKRFFNTSGQLYRSMELSRKLPGMSREEALRLLATDGMLVKRPILVDGSNVLVGFRQPEWEQWQADVNGNPYKS